MKKINNLSFFLIWFNVLLITIIVGSIILFSKFSQKSKIYFERKYSNLTSIKTELKVIENSEEKDIVKKVTIYPDSIRDRIRYAYTRGRYDIFETLIKQGIDFNNRMDNVHQETVLMYIAKTLSSSINIKCKIIQLLIDNGADVNITDKNGKTALFFSIYPEISELLMKSGVELEIEDNEGNTALIKSRSWPHSKLLIENGANINAQNNSGFSYLMFAVKHLDFENIKFLINNGADIFAKNDRGRNILMYSNKAEIAEYLIDLGLNVNSFDQNKRTPLHYAIIDAPRNKEYVEILLAYGANMNAKNWRGEIPIMLSVKYGVKEITKLLIEKGVEFDLEDLFIQLAKANKFDENLALFLFEQGVDINYQDIDGKTALIHSVERGGRECIKMLLFFLEQNADINICDNNGQSAIFYTVGFPSRKEALELLILHGANLNIKNKWNKTTLFYAKTNCDSSIVNILKNNGAK